MVQDNCHSPKYLSFYIGNQPPWRKELLVIKIYSMEHAGSSPHLLELNTEFRPVPVQYEALKPNNIFILNFSNTVLIILLGSTYVSYIVKIQI